MAGLRRLPGHPLNEKQTASWGNDEKTQAFPNGAFDRNRAGRLGIVLRRLRTDGRARRANRRRAQQWLRPGPADGPLNPPRHRSQNDEPNAETSARASPKAQPLPTLKGEMNRTHHVLLPPDRSRALYNGPPSACRGPGQPLYPRLLNDHPSSSGRMRSSAGEHLVHTEGVTGSIPVASTMPRLDVAVPELGAAASPSRRRPGRRTRANDVGAPLRAGAAPGPSPPMPEEGFIPGHRTPWRSGAYRAGCAGRKRDSRSRAPRHCLFARLRSS